MKRFEKVFSQGTMDVVEIWVDTETGVNYLWHKCANAGGLTREARCDQTLTAAGRAAVNLQ